MTRHPYGHDELDRHDPALDDVARGLEAHAQARGGEPSADLRARIHAAIDAEPAPTRGWWSALLAGPAAWAPAVRGLAVAGVAVAAVVGAVGLAGLVDGFRNVGSSPSPIVSPTAEPTPTTSPSPTITPITSPSPTPSVAPTDAPSPTTAPTAAPATPGPTASDHDDDDDDDDDDDETPEPSESDNSGSGSGDD